MCVGGVLNQFYGISTSPSAYEKCDVANLLNSIYNELMFRANGIPSCMFLC